MQKKLLIIYAVLFSTLVALFPTTVFAEGVAASPSVVTATDIPLGKDSFIYAIKVLNQTNENQSYAVFTQKPASTREGYEIIPDPRWMQLDQVRFQIPANSTQVVNLSVKIPNNEVNASKNYEGWFIVRQETGGMVNLQVAVRVLLTTTGYNADLPREPMPIEPIPDSTYLDEPNELDSTDPIKTSSQTKTTTVASMIGNDQPEGQNQFPIIPVAAIGGGTIVLVTLIITLLGRKKRIN
jgi:hypothetical protein